MEIMNVNNFNIHIDLVVLREWINENNELQH